mmetsp:Transcript_9289/g.24560  ORF Transcript_9289/g.24560 Transcript_9289/m.24560 type:complete len:137 (+) Transcript_9289:88-498(+)
MLLSARESGEGDGRELVGRRWRRRWLRRVWNAAALRGARPARKIMRRVSEWCDARECCGKVAKKRLRWSLRLDESAKKRWRRYMEWSGGDEECALKERKRSKDCIHLLPRSRGARLTARKRANNSNVLRCAMEQQS